MSAVLRKIQVTASALLLSFSCAQAADKTLTIVSWGGTYQNAQNEVFFKPFAEREGLSVTQDVFNGETAKIQAMVASGNVTWDVVDVTTQNVVEGCEAGLFVKIDWSRIADKSRFVPGATSDCGVGTIVYSLVIGYNGETMASGPTSPKDFFDLTKFPGKRGMQKAPYGNLEYALMADGVPADQVYKVLRTPEGVDRAFKKLDTIKGQVVWWTTWAQPTQLLASGEVVMTTGSAGRINAANKDEGKKFKIVWDGQQQDFDMWVIIKGTKKEDESYKFIAFASKPEEQAKLPSLVPNGPTNLDALPLVDKAILPTLPTAPENAANAMQVDAQFWADYGPQLRDRFASWLAQ